MCMSLLGGVLLGTQKGHLGSAGAKAAVALGTAPAGRVSVPLDGGCRLRGWACRHRVGRPKPGISVPGSVMT